MDDRSNLPPEADNQIEREERLRGDYARDQWMRETAAAMGMPAARGKFVQVFINGLYWGLYNLVERPDAAFMAALDGEEPFNHDSRNADKVLARVFGDSAVI